jgi:hypothetical protein
MFRWTFFEPYRQMAASVPKNLLACHHYVTNQSTTKHGCLGMPHSTGLCSSTLRMMSDATTPSNLLSRRPCMTPLQLVPLHQPIQTWMNECAMFFLTSLVSHMQMGVGQAHYQCHKTGSKPAPQVVSTEGSGYSCSRST